MLYYHQVVLHITLRYFRENQPLAIFFHILLQISPDDSSDHSNYEHVNYVLDSTTSSSDASVSSEELSIKEKQVLQKVQKDM